jgi:hypothetical protein
MLVARTGANRVARPGAAGFGSAESLIRERASPSGDGTTGEQAHGRGADGAHRVAPGRGRAIWLCAGRAGLRRNLIGLGVVTWPRWAPHGSSRRMTRSVRTLIDGARGLAAAPACRSPCRRPTSWASWPRSSIGRWERHAAEAAVAARQHRIRALADVNRSISQQLDLEPCSSRSPCGRPPRRAQCGALGGSCGQTLRRRAEATDPSVGSVDLPAADLRAGGGRSPAIASPCSWRTSRRMRASWGRRGP